MFIKTVINKINSYPTTKELMVTSFWSIIGSFLSKGIIFIVWIFIGRILGSSDYGAFGLIRETVILFASFAGLGLGITASKYISEYFVKDREKAVNILSLTMQFGIMMGMVVGILFYVFAPYIADNMIKTPQLVNELRISSVILFFSALNGAQIGALQGLMRFRQIAIINLLQSILSFPIFYLGARFYGLTGAVYGLACYYVIISILSHIELHKALLVHKISLPFLKAWRERNIILTYSFPAFSSGIVVVLTKWWSDVMLVNSCDGFYEIGLFTAAYTFNSIFMMIVATIDAPFLVLLSKNKENNIHTNLNRINIIFPWFIGVIVILPFIIYPEIGELLYGKSFAGSSFRWTFILVLLFTLVIMYKQGLARLLAVHNMQWISLCSNAIWAIILFVSFIMLQNLGAVGLCISYLFAYIISTIIIMPILSYMKLIPANTIFSHYALYIWMIILIVFFINFYELSSTERLPILLVSTILVVVLFYKYINRR